MRYVNAREVFPTEILQIIQNYVDGEYIYIPKREENKKAWGELTQSKEELQIRNIEVLRDHKDGVPIHNLSEKFYLSPKTIQRIIAQGKMRK